MGRRTRLARRTLAILALIGLVTALFPFTPLRNVADAHGETVASPRYIAAALMPNGQVGLVFSNNGTEIRFVRYRSEQALDPSIQLAGGISSWYPQLATFRGRLVAAFVDTRPGLSGRLAFRISDDNGQTWEATIYPFGAETFNGSMFAPRVVADRDGQTLRVFSGSGIPQFRSSTDTELLTWTPAAPAGNSTMRPAIANSCSASSPECFRAHSFSFMETATPGRWIYVAKSPAGFGQSGRGTQVGTLGGSWSAQVDHGGSGGLTGCCGHSTATTMLDRDGNILFLRSRAAFLPLAPLALSTDNIYFRKSTNGGISWGPFVTAYSPELKAHTTGAPVGLYVPGYSLGEYVWYTGWYPHPSIEHAARVIPLWTGAKPYADTGTVRLFGSAGGDLPEPGPVRPLIFIPGFGGSRLIATESRNRTITTSDGQPKHVSYGSGGLVWLDEGLVIKAIHDPEWFGILRFNDDGTPPPQDDFAPDGDLVTAFGRGYPDVESALTAAGYVRGQTYFLFTYDFRYGAETWIDELDNLVVHALAANPGAPGVDIVAHSMGALVTRAYLTNGRHASSVSAAVLMGGPLLGTPRGSYAATAGVCLAEFVFICVLDEQTEQYIVRTLPGGLQLGASSSYYEFFRGQDPEHPVAYVDRTLVAGPRSGVGDYSLLRGAMLVSGVGPEALSQAEAFHEDDLEWLRQRATDLSLIVGSGTCTLAQAIAYTKPTYRNRLELTSEPPFFRIVREFAGYVTAYDVGQADGDDTVVRQSASLSDPAAGLSASGDAAIYYRALSHEALAGGANFRDTVLPLLRGESVGNGEIGRPHCTQVTSHSPVELLLTDDAGRRIGRTAEGAELLDEVPQATYDRYLDARSIVLNAPAGSTVTLTGTDEGDATIRVRWLEAGVVKRLAIFPHIPVTSHSRGTFSIDDGGRTVGDLILDLNGDGQAVLTFAPVMLDGGAAEDVTPPELAIEAPGDDQAVVGQASISWIATDAGSGMGMQGAAIDLSSGGRQFELPALVELPPGTHTLDVFAEDRAGNLAAEQRTFEAYSYEWLPPFATRGQAPLTLKAGSTIPVRFAVRRSDGTAVRDDSVAIELVDAEGLLVGAPLRTGKNPASGVTFQGGTYHANVSTDGLLSGTYLLRVLFDSPRLAGALLFEVFLE